MAFWIALIGRNHREMLIRIYLNVWYYFSDGQSKCAVQHYRVAISRADIYEIEKKLFYADRVLDCRKGTVRLDAPKFRALRCS